MLAFQILLDLEDIIDPVPRTTYFFTFLRDVRIVFRDLLEKKVVPCFSTNSLASV
jgi:hypothetical protein